jgi:protein disulfide-isomerase
MKKIIAVLLLTIASIQMSYSQDIMWFTDIKMATDQAIKEKKPIMLFFTGSDWCGWCHKLQADVLNKPAFVEWARQNVIAVELDFPRNKKMEPNLKAQNDYMGNLLGVSGYPTVWFVEASYTATNQINFARLGSQGYINNDEKVWIESAAKILKNK